MRYKVGDKILTKYGKGVIVNILEMRSNIICFETVLEETNKKVPVFFAEIEKIIK